MSASANTTKKPERSLMNTVGLMRVYWTVGGLGFVGILLFVVGVYLLQSKDGPKVRGTVKSVTGNPFGDKDQEKSCVIGYTHPKTNNEKEVMIRMKKCTVGATKELEYHEATNSVALYSKDSTTGFACLLISIVFLLIATLMYNYRTSKWLQGGLIVSNLVSIGG